MRYALASSESPTAKTESKNGIYLHAFRLLLLTCWPWFLRIVWLKMNYPPRRWTGFHRPAARLSFCLLICPSCFIEPVFLRLLVFEVELRHPRLSRLVPNPGCWLVATLYITIALPLSRSTLNPQLDRYDDDLIVPPTLCELHRRGQRCDGFISLVA